MLLTPRYDDRPVITVGGDQLDQCESLLRQRRRMESTLARLTDEQWAHSSRCAGWSVKDVVSHLVEVNRFWTRSIRSGVAGNPTRLLATFDPVAMPAHAVDVVRGHAPGEVLARFAETNQALADTVDGLDAHSWSATAEAPPGHLSVRAVAHHALWDAWIHERDIAVPLGLSATEEPDEVLACLRYVAALGPAFALTADRARRGALVVDATDPAATIVITIDDCVTVRAGMDGSVHGAAHISGRAVDLIEMISLRAPFIVPVRPEDLWIFEGLATAFDSKVDLVSRPAEEATGC